jgi:hypothetical protein
MKTEIIHVRVEPELAEALARHKDQSGVPTGEFIRRAIVRALQGPAPIEYRDAPAEERHARAAQVLVAAASKTLRKVEQEG